MKKFLCSECRRQKINVEVVHRTGDGELIYTCVQCWGRLDYDWFMLKPEARQLS